MSNFLPANEKLGILGGGQLGKMLLQKAADYNIECHVLDPSSDAPAKAYAHYFTQGNFNDFDTVYLFGKNVNVLTIEIEHVNVDALIKLEQEGVHVYPQPNIIKTVQDKGLQKQFYQNNKIPTSPFKLVDNSNDIENSQFPVIQKLRKFGYDGRGVQKLSSASDSSIAFTEPSIIEELVDIDKELSVVVARNTIGEVRHYDPVELVFNDEANLLDYLVSPANISEEISNQAIALARQVIKSFEMVGILAVELFLTKKGELLVNEIAPRPHNSGHQSIEANFTSQYDQHLRCIFGLNLGDTNMYCPSVMLNLLGEDGYTGDADYVGLNDAMKMSGVHVHLYGKKTTKPFRKMGHVTITNENLKEAMKIADELKNTIKIISK
ncbi:MAG: 5-(carboxyamino)imidazole ribonucleotide synthase [Bacteroidia bacterium]|nr:5-(carboxyamino)imidazole ribonucleotide synthase [Bacteroidia bacterium]